MSNSYASVVVDKKIGANFRKKERKKREERGGEEGEGEERRKKGRRKISYSFRN